MDLQTYLVQLEEREMKFGWHEYPFFKTLSLKDSVTSKSRIFNAINNEVPHMDMRMNHHHRLLILTRSMFMLASHFHIGYA